MARKVKCQICGNYGTNETFYKITDKKGRNKYYCNKEEYDTHEKKKQDRYELLKFVAEEILEYENGQIVPPSMVKKIEKLNDFYEYEVIHKTFNLNKETIHYWIRTKDFSNEFGMVSYIMRIIEGNINDVYKQWKFKKQQEQKQDLTSVDLNLLNDKTVILKNKSNDGISSFLDDDDI